MLYVIHVIDVISALPLALFCYNLYLLLVYICVVVVDDDFRRLSASWPAHLIVFYVAIVVFCLCKRIICFKFFFSFLQQLIKQQ